MKYTAEQYKDFTTIVAHFCESLDAEMPRDPDNLRAEGARAVLDCIDKIYAEVFGETA